MTGESPIENLLLSETSRRNTDLVTGLVRQKPELFDELARIMLRNEEPEIRKELSDSIEWRITEETSGFRVHGKRILRKLSKDFRDLHQPNDL